MLRPDICKTNYGVPVVSNDQIDDYAETLVRDYDVLSLVYPAPLDVEAFTEDYLGLHLHYENLSHNGCILGMMVFDNCKIPVYCEETRRAEYSPVNANTVVIDNTIANGKESLFRSSVMHECGHGIYHRDIFSLRDRTNYGLDDITTSVAACRASDFIPSGRKTLRTPREWLEHQAKYFSAAILMPRYAMKVLCNNSPVKDLSKQYPPEVANNHRVKIVADTFGVSEQSARIRLNQLKLDTTPAPTYNKFFI
jgi:Zn-dependent peptidase ImmA (M78 family)